MSWHQELACDDCGMREPRDEGDMEPAGWWRLALVAQDGGGEGDPLHFCAECGPPQGAVRLETPEASMTATAARCPASPEPGVRCHGKAEHDTYHEAWHGSRLMHWTTAEEKPS